MRHLHLQISGKFELWVLVAVVLMCSICTAAVSIYVLTDSTRRCHDINQANKGNRQAWLFMQATIEARWEKNPPSPAEQQVTKDFFSRVQEFLAPISC